MQDDDDLSFVIPTNRLRDTGETVEQYDEHFWRNGHSPEIIVFDDSSPANQLYESAPPKLYGGTERVVSYLLTEELVRLGHEVTLFASGDLETSARLVPACKRALWRDPDLAKRMAQEFLAPESFSGGEFAQWLLPNPVTTRWAAITVASGRTITRSLRWDSRSELSKNRKLAGRRGQHRFGLGPPWRRLSA